VALLHFCFLSLFDLSVHVLYLSAGNNTRIHLVSITQPRIVEELGRGQQIVPREGLGPALHNGSTNQVKSQGQHILSSCLIRDAKHSEEIVQVALESRSSCGVVWE
jgi:hypothetical protein